MTILKAVYLTCYAIIRPIHFKFRQNMKKDFIMEGFDRKFVTWIPNRKNASVNLIIFRRRERKVLALHINFEVLNSNRSVLLSLVTGVEGKWRVIYKMSMKSVKKLPKQIFKDHYREWELRMRRMRIENIENENENCTAE